MADDVVAGSAKELAALYPASKSVMVAGRMVKIHPCGIEQLPIFAGFMVSFSAGLREGLIALAQSPIDSSAFIAESSDAPIDWVLALDPIDRFRLVVEVVEFNEPFFLGALPLLLRLVGVLNRLNGDGPMSSASSPTTATPIPPATPPKQRIRSPLPSAAPLSATKSASASPVPAMSQPARSAANP